MTLGEETPEQEPAPQPDAPHPPSRRLPRRAVLGAAGVGVVGLIGGGTASGMAIRHTRRAKTVEAATTAATPDPPEFTVLTDQPGQAAGDIFLTVMGDNSSTLITDGLGHKVWSEGGAKSYADLRLQTYQGRPVITWWESHSTGLAAYADGRTVITDLDHHEIASVERHAGVSPDEHEFLITPRNTAYIVSYVATKADLRKVKGGDKHGPVLNGVFEEVDLATGRVLHHWESLDHVAVTESHANIPDDPKEPYDYFHINSVCPTADGNVIISARHTWAVYKINIKTGRVMWRLGGKRSDFDLPKSATFAWQHNAQFEDPTTLRMFDNGSDGDVTVTAESQVLWFTLDEAARKARLVRRLVHPDKVSALAMGNAQRLPNGNLFVGWGTAKRISEFSPDGELIFDATLPELSYRAYRYVWR